MWSLWTKGTLSADLKVPVSGRYKVSILASGDQAGNEPARIAVYAGGKLLQRLDIPNRRGAEKAFHFECQLSEGVQSMRIDFENDYYDRSAPRGRQDRNLHVGYLEARPLKVTKDKERIKLLTAIDVLQKFKL